MTEEAYNQARAVGVPRIGEGVYSTSKDLVVPNSTQTTSSFGGRASDDAPISYGTIVPSLLLAAADNCFTDDFSQHCFSPVVASTRRAESSVDASRLSVEGGAKHEAAAGSPMLPRRRFTWLCAHQERP